MNGKIVQFVVIALLLSMPARAEMMVAQRYLQDASLVGEARLKVWLWDVFDARLYSPAGRYDSKQPFTLSLSYLRSFKGDEIVQATIDAMQSQGRYSQAELSTWAVQLSTLIPNVDAGNTITGVRDSNGHTVLYRNGKRLGKIEDREFTGGFFDIWLGEKSSKPGLRDQLLSSGASSN